MTSLYEPNFLDPGPKFTQVVPAIRGGVDVIPASNLLIRLKSFLTTAFEWVTRQSKKYFFLDEFSLMKHDTRHRCTRLRIDGIKQCYVVFQEANKR